MRDGSCRSSSSSRRTAGQLVLGLPRRQAPVREVPRLRTCRVDRGALPRRCRDGASRGITGISMGGYGAVKIALKHPDLYGSVSALSGAIIPFGWEELERYSWVARYTLKRVFGARGGQLARRERRLADPLGPVLRRAAVRRRARAGTEDVYGLDGVAAQYGMLLNEHGVPTTVVLEPGGHDWDYWRRAMQEILAWHGARFEYDAAVMADSSTNGHRLVLFDIDGTLLSAGRVARDSILRALEDVLRLEATRRARGPRQVRLFGQDRSPDRARARPRGRRPGAVRGGPAARAGALPRGARAAARPRRRGPQAGDRGAARAAGGGAPRHAGLLTGNLERGRAAEARAARVQPLLSLRRVRQRLGGPLRAAAGGRGAGARAHGPALRGQVGRHRGRLGPRRGLRARRWASARSPWRPGITSPSASRPRSPDALFGFLRHRARDGGDPRMKARSALRSSSRRLAPRRPAPAPSPPPPGGASRAPYDSPAGRQRQIAITLDMRAARAILALLSRPNTTPPRRRCSRPARGAGRDPGFQATARGLRARPRRGVRRAAASRSSTSGRSARSGAAGTSSSR